MIKSICLLIFLQLSFYGYSQTTTENTSDSLVSYSHVNVDAWYIPGKNEWKKFLDANIKYNLPKRKRAKKGLYIVKIGFTINKDGSLSDITKISNNGFGLEEEAMRVILLSSNDWLPAEYNGKRVMSQKIEEITIQVN